MGRLTRQEEKARHYKCRKLMAEGHDHHFIGEALGMRSQNAKALMESLKDIDEKEIVSPSQQRETLLDITDRISEDLDNIDRLIEFYEEDKEKYQVRLEKLYKLKKEYYDQYADMWAIPSSISSDKQSVSSISGDKVQINFDRMDWGKLDKLAAAGTKLANKERLKDEPEE